MNASANSSFMYNDSKISRKFKSSTNFTSIQDFQKFQSSLNFFSLNKIIFPWVFAYIDNLLIIVYVNFKNRRMAYFGIFTWFVEIFLFFAYREVGLRDCWKNLFHVYYNFHSLLLIYLEQLVKEKNTWKYKVENDKNGFCKMKIVTDQTILKGTFQFKIKKNKTFCFICYK